MSRELTALDGIAVVITSLLALFCWVFPFRIAPQFAALFATEGFEIPLLTKLGPLMQEHQRAMSVLSYDPSHEFALILVSRSGNAQ